MKVMFNHVGIGVGDIIAGVEFYCLALGCRQIGSTVDVAWDGPNGDRAVDVLSSRPFRRMKMANLITSDGVGLELFELVDPEHETRDPPLAYWESGTFHFCVTVADLNEAVEQIVGLGGMQISKQWQRYPEDASKRMVFCMDPWGDYNRALHTYFRGNARPVKQVAAGNCWEALHRHPHGVSQDIE